MATNTYVALDKITVGSSVSNVSFTSVNSGYSDLVIVGQYGSTATEDYLLMQFNSDTATNYSTVSMQGNGSSAVGGRSADRTSLYVDWNSSCENALTKICNLSIMDYRNTSTYKSVVIRGDRATSTTPTYTGTEAQLGVWRKTPEAITTILLKMATGNILAGSTFTLYGIAKLGTTPAVKATGGVIYSDDTYYYHVFGSTGVFTPTQSISADVLCVAGGGGGAHGGAGAGGLTYYSAQSLTATNYAVTVGAGGAAGNTAHSTRGSNGGNSQFASLTASVGGGGGGTGFPGQTSGSSGGSGGGGAQAGAEVGSGGGNTAGQGNVGGGSGTASGFYSGGAGGGAGAAGTAGNSAVNGGIGGVGVSTYSAWGLATGTGENVSGVVYYAGGGGGGSDAGGGVGGYGGGTKGVANNPTAGLPFTGGGAGGTSNGVCANGGSGVVIVRYAKA